MGIIFDTILLDICLLPAVVLLAVLFHYMDAFTYWKRKNVRFISPSFPWGSVALLAEDKQDKQNFGDYFVQMYRTARFMKERFIGFYVFTKPLMVIADPDLIKSILVKDINHFQRQGLYFSDENDPLSRHLVNLTGLKWKRIRKKVTPILTTGKMKMMFLTLLRCCDEIETVIQEAVQKDEPIDTRDILKKLTINNIGSCVFGLNCNSFKDPDYEFQKHEKMFLKSAVSNARNILVAFRKLLMFHRISFIKKGISDFCFNIFKDILKETEKTKDERKDFIDLYIKLQMSQTIDETDSDEDVCDDQILTFNELVAHGFEFFAAGFEASAATINYCLFELAQKLDVQRKLRDEILIVLNRYNGEVSYDAVMEMMYLEQVVNETLRKYPPIPILKRECTNSYRIIDSNITLEKGVQIWISILGLHNDPEFYPNPEVFNPDRFTKEEVGMRHPFVYLPFGDGPSNCVGFRFGYLYIKVALITLLRSYTYILDPGMDLPFQFNKKGIFLPPKDKIYLRAQKVL